jgi:hypothetical protein
MLCDLIKDTKIHVILHAEKTVALNTQAYSMYHKMLELFFSIVYFLERFFY